MAVYTTNGHADGDVKGNIDFVGCHFDHPQREGIVMMHKPADGALVRFTDCEVIEPGAADKKISPVVFQGGHGNRLPLGGVEFANLTIVDSLGRQPLALQDWAGGLGVEKVSGKLRLRGQDGAERVVDLTPEVLKAWMPETAFLRFPQYPVKNLKPLVPGADAKAFDLGKARMRGNLVWLLYAEAGQAVSCVVRYGQVGKYAARPMPVRAVAPSGKVAGTVNAEFMKDTPFGFTAPETGVYRISAEPGGNWAALANSSHPVCLTSAVEPIPFFAMIGEFWFWVPAGVEQFAIKCFGDGTEGNKVSLYDGTGKLFEEKDDITRPYQFVVKRPAGSPGEAWRMVIARGTTAFLEDFHVVMEGLPPLLAPTREGLLVPARVSEAVARCQGRCAPARGEPRRHETTYWVDLLHRGRR